MEKKCCQCHDIKPTTEFYKNKRRSDGIDAACKSCIRRYKALPSTLERQRTLKRERHRENPLPVLLRQAFVRSRKKGIEFSITLADLVLPEKCPLLGIPLFVGVGTVCDNSPTIDRIDPTKGYTPDNVWIISNRANAIKNNATLSELLTLSTNLRKKIDEQHR